jgi:hypothetical protein
MPATDAAGADGYPLPFPTERLIVSKTKRFIRSTEEAKAAPVGTIVLLSSESADGRRIASQKHDDGWYISSAWEGSGHDRHVRGEVLVWGEVKAGRQVTDTDDAPAPATEETAEVVAYRDRLVQNLGAHATLLHYQDADEEHIAGVRDAATRIEEGLV